MNRRDLNLLEELDHWGVLHYVHPEYNDKILNHFLLFVRDDKNLNRLIYEVEHDKNLIKIYKASEVVEMKTYNLRKIVVNIISAIEELEEDGWIERNDE